jgi:NAD(P)-dependent dehydrogenase (short-subunit alcohol dehydrogenase family)
MASSAPDRHIRVWLITGTSQGFGSELVRAALQRGDLVVATSRTPSKVAEAFPDAGERLFALSMDLRDEAQITDAVQLAIARFGHIDVLVNNAGHGLLGAIEETSDAEVRNVFETNVFGLLRVTRAVLPSMRKRRRGHIVNISSIGGLVGSPGWGIYNSTKFAVEGISEALFQELAPLGIGVTVVEPGLFRTDFLGGSLTVANRALQDYVGTAGRTRTWRGDTHGQQQGDPGRGAEAIVKSITAERPPLHLLLGADAYERAHKKLDAIRSEFEAWRETTFSTNLR